MIINIFPSSGGNSTGGANIKEWSAYHNAHTAYGANMGHLTVTDSVFKITGLQMEIGDQHTDFEHRRFGDELKLCQRYFSVYHACTQEWIYYEGSTFNHKWWQTYVPTGMRNEPSVTLGGTCSTNNISAGGGTISALAVQAIDNGGNAGTTHLGSMGRVSYRVTFTGSHGSARQVYHADGWGNGAGWVEYNSEL